MAKKVEIEIDVNTNIEGSIAQLKELKKQLKQTAAGSEDFKKLYNQIDDLEDKIKGAKKASSDWVDTLESAGGPIGALGGAINKAKVATQSFGAAFKAIGIGLIVSLIGGLVAAFSETEGSMKKLEPLFIAMQKILGGIFEAIQPLLDAFIELAISALPYITQGIKILYSSLVAFFTLVKEAGTGVGKILKGLFTLDLDTIKEGYSQLTGSWGKTVEAYEATEERFEKGYAKKTKREKEADKNSRELLLKRLEAQDKYDEAMLEKMKQSALALATTEQEKLDVEMAFAKKSYDLKNAEIDKRLKLEKKGSAEEKTLLAEKIANDADYQSKLTGFAENQKKLLEDNIKAQKDWADKKREILAQTATDEIQKSKDVRASKYQKDLEDLEADKEFIKESESVKSELRKALFTTYNNDLIKIERDARIQQYSDELAILTAQQKTLTEGTQAYLTNSLAIENDAYKIKIEQAKGNAAQIEAINIEHEQNLKDIKLKAFIAEKQIVLDRLAVIGSIGSSLGQLAGKNKAIAIAAIAIEKAAAIGNIIVNTQIANAKAVAASPLTFGMPWVAINTIAGALGVAAAIASGVKAIQDINAVQIPGASASGGGGGSSSASMPAYGGGGASASVPTINTGGGANPATQISQTIQSSTSQPVRAYVVSADISNQQQLDRRANKGATFANG
jgi:hypothetical protein